MGLAHPRFAVWAAQDGRVEDLVFHLRRSGKEALKPYANSPKKQTPLHLSAIRGHVKCIRVLCEAGSNLNVPDKDGHTPLHLSVANQHLGSTEVLLQLGATANIETRFGVTPLHIAASVGHSPCAQMLVQWGANVNAQESWGQTPLVVATLKGKIHCMKTLVLLGADPEIKDYHHSQTALHVACASQDEECVLVLLDAGCEVHAVNGEGLSSLGVAIANKFYRVVPLLLEYGATLNDVDRETISEPLLEHIDQQTEAPRSLLRQCRVAVRKSLRPTSEQQLATLSLSKQMQSFLQNILELCDGQTIRAKNIQGNAVKLSQQAEKHDVVLE